LIEIRIGENAMYETISDFYSALAKDETMRSRMAALGKKHKETQPDENAAAAELAAFANAEGYGFTPEQFLEHAKQSRELSDKELESVAGGGCGCFLGGSGHEKGWDPKSLCTCICAGLGGPIDNCGCLFAGWG
jgi:predicted ribosomally synthesized peptide with nif11-like leader